MHRIFKNEPYRSVDGQQHVAKDGSKETATSTSAGVSSKKIPLALQEHGRQGVPSNYGTCVTSVGPAS